MRKTRIAAKPLSSMCLIPPWLAILKQPSPCVPGAHVEKDESAPPKPGGHVTFRRDMMLHVSTPAPWGSLSSSFIPAGRLRNSPPFPSRFIVSDRSSPSRVRFAASRPRRLRADPKDALLTRGKGGGRAVGREGKLANDKGYYHPLYRHGAQTLSSPWIAPPPLPPSCGAPGRTPCSPPMSSSPPASPTPTPAAPTSMSPAAFIQDLQGRLAPATVKQHLAALRILFDWLVTGPGPRAEPGPRRARPQILPQEGQDAGAGPPPKPAPCSTASGPLRTVRHGDGTETGKPLGESLLVGLRDRALIGAMIYTFARVSAVLRMRVRRGGSGRTDGLGAPLNRILGTNSRLVQ